VSKFDISFNVNNVTFPDLLMDMLFIRQQTFHAADDFGICNLYNFSDHRSNVWLFEAAHKGGHMLLPAVHAHPGKYDGILLPFILKHEKTVPHNPPAVDRRVCRRGAIHHQLYVR
jgi:hypothetical protein